MVATLNILIIAKTKLTTVGNYLCPVIVCFIKMEC